MILFIKKTDFTFFNFQIFYGVTLQWFRLLYFLLKYQLKFSFVPHQNLQEQLCLLLWFQGIIQRRKSILREKLEQQKIFFSCFKNFIQKYSFSIKHFL